MSSWRTWVWLGAAALACNGDDEGTDGTSTDYSFECEVTEPFDLADPFDVIVGAEHQCEEAAYYNPDVPTATSYFVGEFHMDDCGNVVGKETWVLYPNEKWRDLGGRQCQVVWTATGLKEDRVQVGNYSLNLGFVVDDAASDCDGITDFTYDEAYSVVYDIGVSGSESTFYFTPSGNVLGVGEANANHLTYTSGENCKLF